MTSSQSETGNGGRALTPADLQSVRFTRGSLLHPGYAETEVDRVMSRLAEGLGRHIAEKAQLRDQLRALQSQVDGVVTQEPPSEQAVRILAVAQQTADNYVAEAEEFSRQVTSEARAEYEEAVRQARENAGAIIQAAQEAAARIGAGAPAAGEGTGQRNIEELEEQVAYLKAFGQACRVQLRSYLEALLSDIESEWGRADPALLPQPPLRMPAQRSDRVAPAEASTTFYANRAGESADDDGTDDDPEGDLPATAGFRASS